MANIQDAESFARGKNANIDFCRGVVFRLKSIGIAEENTLCSAILAQTKASFDEIYERFGREIATMTTSISRDQRLPRQKQEEQYVKQLQSAPWDATLIKLCEISANLKLLKETEISKTKRSKQLKKELHYLNALKSSINLNKSQTPGVIRLLDGINENLTHFKQRTIKF